MDANIQELFIDYNIHHLTEGHKHCRPGWLNAPCPFCVGNEGYHLGFTFDGRISYCWRCGWHPVEESISYLLKISREEAKKLLRQYVGIFSKPVEAVKAVNIRPFKYPSETTELLKNHRNYLIKREFNPDRIASEWNVLGTGPIARLDKINYSHRLLIPIIWEGETVSFQTRDITDKHPVRYLACPQKREILEHQRLVYCIEKKLNPDAGICVEGVTDAWRLRGLAFATFGIDYSMAQIRWMASRFRRVFIVFDDEPQAQQKAIDIRNELRFRNVEAINIEIVGDPGGMRQSEADYLVKQLIAKH